MYGSRMAGHVYLKAVMGLLLSNGFTASVSNQFLLTKLTAQGPIHVFIIMDDFLVASPSRDLID